MYKHTFTVSLERTVMEVLDGLRNDGESRTALIRRLVLERASSPGETDHPLTATEATIRRVDDHPSEAVEAIKQRRAERERAEIAKAVGAIPTRARPHNLHSGIHPIAGCEECATLAKSAKK